MQELKFYKCAHCGNFFLVLHDGGVNPVCCGEPMMEMKPGTTDAAQEKHVPELTRNGNKLHVQVGSVKHPMEEDHWIVAIVAQQGDKIQVKELKPGEEPVADFEIADGPVVVYEYCNKHGVWKAEA